MKKTYITRMPDKTGAFLVASRIISEEGGNIVRVNYNRAVDIHTLFIEVSAEPGQHSRILERLTECGYLANEEAGREIIMIVLKLNDVPGAVTPVLEVLNNYNVNISYISSQENGTGVQHFKMGLLVENTEEIAGLIKDISGICEINILDYEVTDRLLDGTVFYITFANEMRKILNLSQSMTNKVLICANRLMQQLDEQKKDVLKTFDYIRRFALFVSEKKDSAYLPSASVRMLGGDMMMYIMEPPCGSNTYVLKHKSEILFADSGFACYRREMISLISSLIPDINECSKIAMITHADVDHAGVLSLADKIYMSESCYENFVLEHRGENNFREQNPLHEPYCFLSKIISGYEPPELEKCVAVGGKKDGELISYIGSIEFAGRKFDFYEGSGGHIRGETVIVCEELKLLFSGDIYVNIKGFSEDQKEFNRLAPFLMTGVDADAGLSKKERNYLTEKYKGYLICPGHGAVVYN